MRGWVAVATAAVAAACAANPAPVPLVADRDGRKLLQGEWAGQYASPQTGRVGSIAFSLVQHDTGGCEAHGEHAHGDVLMIPRSLHDPAREPDGEFQSPGAGSEPQVLRIELMRVQGDRLTGTIEPYRDPDTGMPVSTTFDGSIAGDLITGAFVTVNSKTGDRYVGTWEVRRKQRDT